MLHCEKRWAVVLGASSGTGAAVTCALAERAHLDVFGVHRGNHPDEAEHVIQDVERADQRCHMRIANAGTPEGAVQGVAELLDVAGPKSVKIFVHSIADASYGRFSSCSEDQLHPKQIEKTFDRMAHSFIYWVQEMRARDVLADGARIIGLTNPMVDSDVNGWGLVAAAKSALATYVRMLGLELGPLGYRVALLKFGLVETQAIKMAFSDNEWRRLKDVVCELSPLGRLCTVEEIGAFVADLLGEGGEWFNGGTIDYTGAQVQSLLNYIFGLSKRRVYDDGERSQL